MYDLTEVDSEDDSDCDSGPESFVFPAESDDDLDSVIDALERDLEDVGASVLQPAAEVVQEVAPQVDMQEIPVVGIRPREDGPANVGRNTRGQILDDHELGRLQLKSLLNHARSQYVPFCFFVDEQSTHTSCGQRESNC